MPIREPSELGRGGWAEKGGLSQIQELLQRELLEGSLGKCLIGWGSPAELQEIPGPLAFMNQSSVW